MRGGRRAAASAIAAAAIGLVAVAVVVPGCRRDPAAPLGPPDSFVVLFPEPSGATSPGGLPLMRRLEVSSPEAAPLAKLFAEGFAAEMLRTVYLAGQLVPSAPKDALPVVLGLDRVPYGRGLALEHTFGGPEEKAQVVWIGLPADVERDKALVQTLSGRLATYALHLVMTKGRFADVERVVPKALEQAYRMAMEVIAREWRVGKGPQGVVPYDAGTETQRTLFADIRENRAVLASGGLTARPAAELLANPVVAATVLYRMAQSRIIAQRPAPAAFYAPFAPGRLPPNVSPAAVLGPIRNFQAKLLTVWSSSARPPQDIAELVTAYAAAFPQEKMEALRIFVVTTLGATVQEGGVSARPQDASKALATLDALVADVAAGRRTLRAATVTPPP